MPDGAAAAVRSRRWIGGYAVDVRAWPDGAGPPFVLVHGIGVSHRTYRRLARILAGTAATYVLDLPGTGTTRKPARPLDVDELAEVLAATLADLRLEGAVLVGHSMGGQVVAATALLAPRRVSALVLLGPTVDPRHRSAAALAARLLLDALREPVSLVPIVLADYLRFGIRRFLVTAGHMLRDRIEDRLPRCDVPVAVVRGTRDPIAQPSWVAALAGRAPHGSGVEVRSGTHAVQWSRPAEVGTICRDLAASAAGRPGAGPHGARRSAGC